MKNSGTRLVLKALFAAILSVIAIAVGIDSSRAATDTQVVGSEKATRSAVRGELRYGQANEFWDIVDQLASQPKTPAQVESILDPVYESPREGIAAVEVKFEGRAAKMLDAVFTHGYFGAGAQWLAGGRATNRILPELKGYRVTTGEAQFGFKTVAFDRDNDSGFEWQVGSVAGLGSQSIAQGAIAEFVSGAPIKTSSIFYWGGELGFGYHAEFSETLRSHHELLFLPTIYHSDFTSSALEYKIGDDRWAPRWRIRNEWAFGLGSPTRHAAFELTVHSIFGQQPVPVRILPRTWDSVHGIVAFPSAGQLIGLGTGIAARTEDGRFGFSLFGGFYGGYLGAGAIARLGIAKLEAGTYGFEESSGYRLSQSRINYVSLGVVHEF